MPTKVNSAAKAKAKSPAKEDSKIAAKATVKKIDKKATKAPGVTAAKSTGSKVKSPAKKIKTKSVKTVGKNVYAKKTKGQVVPAPVEAIAAKAKSQPKQPKNLPTRVHGRDKHFIPVHVTAKPETIHDGKKTEKVFHNREETALHQENQKAKVGMTSRMGRKRIFRILGR